MGIRLVMNSTDVIIRAHGLGVGGKVQKVVDSEVLRLCDKYVPMRSGELKRSGVRGTVIGSGTVKYIAPYARQQYYCNSGHGKQGTARGGLRGRLWFERMKQAHRREILAAAAHEAGCNFKE